MSLVSIIIPTFNRRELAAESIDSCLHQTYPRIQLIVVDDGSTDGTVEYLEELSRQYPEDRFRYITQANQGPASARNAGLGLAYGKYIKFLDSDDTLELDAIAHYVLALEDSGADLCIGARRYMSAKGIKGSVNYRPENGLIDKPLSKFFNLEIRPQTGFWMFQRRLFDAGLRWNNELLAREDTDLLGEALINGATVTGAPEAILNQRCHAGIRQTARQFEADVFDAIHRSNCRLYEKMQANGCLDLAGRAFSASLCRTTLRLWDHDRATAKRCYALARKAYRNPELLLLTSNYSKLEKIAAYIAWYIGGPHLCAPLWRCRTRMKALIRS